MFIPHILLTGAFALVGVLHTLFQSSAVLFNYPSLGLLSDVPVLAYFISYEISVSSLPELAQTPPALGPEEEEEVGEQCIWGIPGLLVPRAPAFARPEVVSLSPHVVITGTPYKPQVQRAKTTVLHNITTQPVCSPMIMSMCQRKESYNIAPFARVEVLSHKVPEKRAQASWVHKLLHLVFLIFAGVFLCISCMVYLVGGINLSDLKTQPRKVTQKPLQKQTKVSSLLLIVRENNELITTLLGISLRRRSFNIVDTRADHCSGARHRWPDCSTRYCQTRVGLFSSNTFEQRNYRDHLCRRTRPRAHGRYANFYGREGCRWLVSS